VGGPKARELARRVARQIASEREKRHVSQEELAERLGTATRNYQRIESGTQNLTLGTIERIAEALGTSSASLLVGVSTPPTPALPRALARLEAAGYEVTSATPSAHKPPRAIEVTTLRAAAGRVGRAGRSTELLGWVDLGRASPPPRGQFVAEVVGQSMEPRIAAGSLCLFGPARPPPHGERIFLVSVGAHVEDDVSASFFLKRIKSIRHLGGERRRITLESINPSVKPLSIETYADDDLQIVAELLSVIVPGPDAGDPRRR
jgi:transcriptional regulator with XRE-family HTH domain